ncbi:dihydrodipicolinate synthase family protein [Streptomyces sp. SAJ15]|uniref:dihydrodipicolinate synthase family protein n=1 Tax=Streptomyces sp. SAJ15 TaxID=2011095 RepID=UPI0011860D4B|nr:dihydrodipicolinate synthase family protein [Streptomyces sp. SAJ15]TVL93142.1 hypothetical protein CD790_08475 [Streptomyces sp. SAJ15]
MLTETVCSALSAAGLGIAGLTAYRRRFRAAARIAAYALIPLGLVMTGIIDWVADLVFKPSVWLGFGVLGLSWLLFALTRAADRRAVGAAEEHGAVSGAGAGELPAGAGRPAARGRPGRTAGQGGSKKAAAGDDFSEIEAILKKHGI